MSVTSHGPEPCASANSAIPARIKLVDGDGFEPSKSTTTDLQSAPFGRSGTHPRKVIWNWLFGFQGNFGAGDGTRTRNLLITNQLLCQLSYTSQQVWCLRVDLNHRHRDFQSLALPAELPRQKMATRRGLEPLTSSVTGWRTNQLYYRAIKYHLAKRHL